MLKYLAVNPIQTFGTQPSGKLWVRVCLCASVPLCLCVSVSVFITITIIKIHQNPSKYIKIRQNP